MSTLYYEPADPPEESDPIVLSDVEFQRLVDQRRADGHTVYVELDHDGHGHLKIDRLHFKAGGAA